MSAMSARSSGFERLERAAERHAATLLTFASADGSFSRHTVREAMDASLAVAAALRGMGIKCGDVVAIQSATRWEHLLLLLATLRVGAVFLPVLHILREAELTFILNQARAKLLFVPDRWHKTDFHARCAALGDVPSLKDVIFIGESPSSGGTSWAQFLTLGSEEIGARPDKPSDSYLLYTSGTTGTPKGVLHNERSILAEIRNVTTIFDGWSIPSTLSCSVAGHVGGILTLLRPFVLGNPTVFLDRWNAATAARLIRDNELQWCAGGPFFLDSLLQEDRGRGISFFSAGGASVSPQLIEDAERARICAVRSYGSTELPTFTSGRRDQPLLQRAGNDGSLMPGCEIRLIDDEGMDVAAGEAGEILCRGPELFSSYVDRALNEHAFMDGWFRSGDVGVMENGLLRVVDRKKDIIIRGGENISSKEIEDMVRQMPGVVEAAAVPYPDRLMGERAAIFVQMGKGHSINLPEIRRHFEAAGVAIQKTPERLIIVPLLPRNATGKVLKTTLREQLVDDDSTDQNTR